MQCFTKVDLEYVSKKPKYWTKLHALQIDNIKKLEWWRLNISIAFWLFEIKMSKAFKQWLLDDYIIACLKICLAVKN